MSTITINDYSRDVKSLGVVSWDGRRATTGAVTAGSPQHFSTTEKETITVTIGSCRINGKIVNEGEMVVVQEGNEVKIEALGPAGSSATYTCLYGDVVPMEPAVLLATLQGAQKQVVKLVHQDGTIHTLFLDEVWESTTDEGVWNMWYSAINSHGLSRLPIKLFVYAVALGKGEE
jgi:uncharacterized protein YaiE (UPF0345 family)